MLGPPIDVVVGRTPALPAAVARDLYASADPLGATRDLLRNDPDVAAAVRLASPSLHDALQPWLAGAAPKSDRMGRKALAYAVRMATRCTPFGLFASSSAVASGATTTLALASKASRRHHIAPALAWLFDLLEAARAEHRDSTVVANDLVIARGDRLYIFHDTHAQRVPEGATAVWRFEPVSLRSNAAVAWLRELAREPHSIRDLVGCAMQRFGAAPEIAHLLVQRLIEAAVIIPVRPSLQGDPAASMRALREMAAFAEPLNALDDTFATFEAAETALTASDIAALEAAARAVHPFDGTVVHVDTFHEYTGTLGASVARDVSLLASISLAQDAPTALRGFVKRFIDRYEAPDRLVPLLELVHDGFALDEPGVDEAARRREGLLARLAAEAARTHSHEVVISDKQLRALLPSFEPYRVPNACELGFQIVARDRAAIEAGNYTIVASAATTSDGVGKIASRIAPALGAAFSRRVADAHAADADSDALDVELDYVPLDPKVANLLVRPAWRPYAISDASIAGPVERISPADVLVGFEDGRFNAYSKSHGKRLRLNETYLFETAYFAPPHARILSLIAKQDRIGPKPWSWGAAASHLEFQPRVRYERLVLSPAMWSLPKRALLEAGDDAAGALARWRATWDVPRWVYLTERDMRLLLDLDAPVATQLLLDQFASYNSELLRFEEMLPSFDELWLQDPAGNAYAQELVATVPATVAKPRRAPRDLAATDLEGLPVGPGGEWAYLKLYAAETELDALLRDRVGELVAACADLADLDRWFFLRYRDPQHHVRLRVRAKDGNAGALVARLSALLEPSLADGTLRRYAFDTYQPEFERYGGIAAQTAVQRLFRRDSERVLEALRSPAQGGDRVRLALRSVAPFTAAWFAVAPAKPWLDYHSAEARAEKDATDYAVVRELDGWLAEADGHLDPTETAAIADLVALDASGALTQVASAVFSAVVHMHFNRIGIAYDDEPAVRAHLWRAVYGRSARARADGAGKRSPAEALR